MNAAFAQFAKDNDLATPAMPRPTHSTNDRAVELPAWSPNWQICISRVTDEALQGLHKTSGFSLELLNFARAHDWIGIHHTDTDGACWAFGLQDARGVMVGCRYRAPNGEWKSEPAASGGCVFVAGNLQSKAALVVNTPNEMCYLLNWLGENINVLLEVYVVIVAFGNGGQVVGELIRDCETIFVLPTGSPPDPHGGNSTDDTFVESIAGCAAPGTTVRRAGIPSGYNGLCAWCTGAKPDMVGLATVLHTAEIVAKPPVSLNDEDALSPLISLMDISPGVPDPTKTVLGNRFLCKGGGMLFVGPSGIGKSSASMQQDILWSLGRPAFGIQPARPLHILTIQAENDDEDLAEMRDGVCRGLKLTDADRAMVRDHVSYDTVEGRTGDDFLDYLEARLKEKPFDMVRLDHFTAYLGGDPTDTSLTIPFLRGGLNPLLKKYGVACSMNHHTPKTNNRDTSKWRASDWMYAGAGASDVTNWARAILVVDATHVPGVFKFIAAKRGARIGWKDEDGVAQSERYFCHANDGIYWRESSDEDISAVQASAEALRSKGKKAKTPDDFMALVPMDGAIPKTKLLTDAQTAKFAKHTAAAVLKALVEKGDLYEWKIRRSGTNPERRISRHKQTVEIIGK